MICPQCGSQVEGNFCAQCGTRLALLPSSPAPGATQAPIPRTGGTLCPVCRERSSPRKRSRCTSV